MGSKTQSVPNPKAVTFPPAMGATVPPRLSLPRPRATVPWSTLHPRSLVPLETPPQVPSLPCLPSPTRPPASGQLWNLTTHIIPAAYPRTSPALPVAQSAHPSASKKERTEMAKENSKLLLHNREKQLRGEWDGQGSKKILWNCINRYMKLGLHPTRGKRGITLFFAHATGFPKEIWEPTLHRLLSSSSGTIIDEIWSWESVHHGDAALMNLANLDGIFDWSDNTRDILNFLLNYLPSAITPGTLPTYLPRVPVAESGRRKVTGFSDRTIVPIGHSYGGTTSALAAISCPSLFDSLVLVDPVILRPGPVDASALVNAALQRRESWTSREEAYRLLKESPFFAQWDPEVLKLYVEHGLYPDSNGGVRLKMPGVQEAICFAQSATTCEVWELMDKLDERIALRWIVPENPDLRIGGLEMIQERVWLRPRNSSNVIIPDVGHLIPQEAPGALASEIAEFLQRKYGSRARL